MLGKRPSCFLLEVPPGGEGSPDITTQVHSEVLKDSELRMACATATADSVRNDEEFVDLLVREWLKQDDSIRSYWKEEGESVSDLPVPQRLNAFFSECVARNNYRRLETFFIMRCRWRLKGLIHDPHPQNNALSKGVEEWEN